MSVPDASASRHRTGAEPPAALAAVVETLECPHCRDALDLDRGTVRCPRGHAFDVARQGYVNLLSGRVRAPPGDSPAMVEARTAFLARGHHAALAARVVDAAAAAAGISERVVLDVGAGTGYFLAALLDGLPGRYGIALDVSKYALRRAARAHERAAAVAADAWQRLPLRDATAGLALSVFAPRNGEELRRVLHPSGALVVVTPTPAHLDELVRSLSLLTVDPRKDARLAEQLEPHFALVDRATHEQRWTLTHDDVAAAVAMGPSAWHLDHAQTRERIDQLPEPVAVTSSVTLSCYRPS